MNNIIQTEQYTFMYLGIYINMNMYISVLTYIHMQKQSLNLTESKEEDM